MVKQSAFQEDLFDFKYIEDQVTAIKNSMNEPDNTNNKKDLIDILEEQISVLHNIQYLLSEIDNNTKKKKSWFTFKE